MSCCNAMYPVSFSCLSLDAMSYEMGTRPKSMLYPRIDMYIIFRAYFCVSYDELLP